MDAGENYQALVMNSAKKRTSTGLLDPKRELIGESEIAYFSSFKLRTLNDENA